MKNCAVREILGESPYSPPPAVRPPLLSRRGIKSTRNSAKTYDIIRGTLQRNQTRRFRLKRYRKIAFLGVTLFNAFPAACRVCNLNLVKNEFIRPRADAADSISVKNEMYSASARTKLVYPRPFRSCNTLQLTRCKDL